jgi:hypothetical protein
LYNIFKEGGETMKITVEELAKVANVSKSRIYQIKQKLGRMPTFEEVMERKGKVGRPIKEEKTKMMLKYFGTASGFSVFIKELVKRYGENATLKEIIESEASKC